jgi:hypothetical protein
MRAIPRRSTAAFATALTLALLPASDAAQGVEVTPFGGYRFGGDFFELLAARPLDVDGAPTLGLAVDVPFSAGGQVEALFTREQARFSRPGLPSATASIDHWLIGGLQELSGGRARPFLTGLLGLTRYATEGDSEIRFAVSVGGGVKLFPQSRVGLRLDGRAFTTIVDAGAHGYACAPGRTCFLAIHADVVWQAEFTSGIVIRLR